MCVLECCEMSINILHQYFAIPEETQEPTSIHV